MFLAKIIGDVVSDHKIKDYEGLKLLVVQPIDPEGKAQGKTLLAVDNVHAGVGDTVLIMDEGGSARMLLARPRTELLPARRSPAWPALATQEHARGSQGPPRGPPEP